MAALYNRYVPGGGGYTRVVVDDRPTVQTNREERAAYHSSEQSHRKTGRTRTGSRQQDILRNLSIPLGFLGGEDKNAGMAGILKSLHLEDLDSGDILLLLIILFVFLEGDNMELVITLGLMLLLGLGEDKKDDQKE